MGPYYPCECCLVQHVNCSSAGVYSRNRNFRLMGSTKLKKENGELVVAGGNRFRILSPRKTQCDGQMYLKNEQLFYDSIVCNVRWV